MLYIDYMDKVKEIALITDEGTGVTYIKPDYEYALYAANINLDDVTDFDNVSRTTVYRHLVLERDMRNACNDKTPYVTKWLYDVIATVIEPTLIEEQNKLVKDMLEYRKERNAIDSRTEELNRKQQVIEEKNKILPYNLGVDFRKKKP